MQSPILYGTHAVTLDQRDRLELPEEVLEQLPAGGDATALSSIVGNNGKLWLYPESIGPEIASIRLEVDQRAGLTLSAEMRQAIGPGQEFTLVGVRDHFELWNRAQWRNRTEELDASMVSITNAAQKHGL